jgi:hypothetical protein
MTHSPEKDRFDELPLTVDRRGAHRAPIARRRAITFAWSALVTGVLVLAGTIGLFASTGKLDVVAFLLPGVHSVATPTPTVVPTVDAKMAINILNGTATEGLSSKVGDVLTKAGLTVGTKSNSSETSITKTMVFYAQKNFEGAARGACKALGATCAIKFTTAYATSGAPLTMVIGSDYLAPATK